MKTISATFAAGKTIAFLSLAFSLFPDQGWALPRGPIPPVPESGVIYYQGFDRYHSIASGDATATVPGLGLLVQSWSGYALDRSGQNVLPYIVPALAATGHTNLVCDSNAGGSIRFYYEPYYSSGTGPQAIARLADLVTVSPNGSTVAWSLQVSPDGTTVLLYGYGDTGPATLLSAPVQWQANQAHLIALDYGPGGTVLYIDGVVAAQGGGTAAIPDASGALVLGSSVVGTDTAQGAVDEFFSFDHPLSANEIALYYGFTGAEAALGPISGKEASASLMVSGAKASAIRMSVPPVYDPNQDTACSPGGPVRLTNIVATLQTNGLYTISLDVQGGTNGTLYDFFTTSFITNTLTNHSWNFIGSGLTCNSSVFTNQPSDLGFYALAVPQNTMAIATGNNASGQCSVPSGLSNSIAVAAGGYFSLALQENGTVAAWGDNTYGETSLPSNLTNAAAIAAGQYHGLALLSNGVVRTWGSYWDGGNFYSTTNYTGIAGPPSSNVMAIAAGMGHDLALLSNGTVVAWELTNLWATSSNALAFQSNLTGIKAIAAGWNHNVALLSNGVVKAWGLGGSNLAWDLTNVPPNLTNAVAVAAFGLHSLALRTNGTVEAWGYSPNGETNVPSDLTNVVAIAAGGFQSLALQATGTLTIWGESGLTNVPAGVVATKTIAAGFQHNLVLQSDLLTPVIFEEPADQYAPPGSNVTFSAQGESLAGVTYQWQFDGVNVTGATNATLTLTNVQATNNGSYQVVVSASAGSIASTIATFSLVLPPSIVYTNLPALVTNWFSTNIVLQVIATGIGQSEYPLGYQWQLNGTNIYGAEASSYTIPNLAATNEGAYTLVVTNIAGSNTVTWNLRLALPGMVEAWGTDASGEIDRPVSLTNAEAVAAGDYHSVAVTDSGTLLQWGKYYDGTNFYSVGSPPAFSNLVAVAASRGHDLALTATGAITNWGLTNDVANFVPTNLTTPAKAIAAGWMHNLALLTNGAVVVWGTNSRGQTNIPSNLTSANAATAIAAGAYHSLALSNNGTVAAWGDNTYNQTNVPAGLTNIVAIAAGSFHSLALSNNGTVAAWGLNTSGQTTVPAGLSNVMAIAAGSNFSVALRNDGTLVAWGDNTYGQLDIPLNQPVTNITGAPYIVTNIAPPSAVKLLAAGGYHTVAGIFSPLVQYPVDVSRDLLLIYNTNSPGNGSSNVCAYYLANRPMVANANVLAIGCATNEIIDPGDYATNIASPITILKSTAKMGS